MRPFIGLLLALAPACLYSQQRPFEFTPPDEKVLAEANELDQRFERKGLVNHDARAESFLNRIGARLIGSEAPPDRVQFRFRILRDPMINAFALPNGSIYINSGLIAAMENEAELASVMAHEIAHVVNRHTYAQNRSIRKKMVAIDVLVAAGSAGGYLPFSIFGAALTVGAEFSQIVVVSTVYGYSRELESDADTTGYRRMVGSHYPGPAMAQAFEVLDTRLEFEPVEPFWRSHPKLKDRIAAAKKLAQTEDAAHPEGPRAREYLEETASVVRDNIALDLDSRRTRTAVARAKRLVEWNSQNAEYRVLLADAYRALGAKSELPEGDETSDHGKKTARAHMLKLTAAEEQRALLAAPTGKSTLESNQRKSEDLYRQALNESTSLPAAHRGLGMLFQEEGKNAAAADEYGKYLEVAPRDAPDRLRIERRLETCTKGARNP